MLVMFRTKADGLEGITDLCYCVDDDASYGPPGRPWGRVEPSAG